MPLFAILDLLLLLLHLSPNFFIFVLSKGAIVGWWKSEIFGLSNKLCVFPCVTIPFSELCSKHLLLKLVVLLIGPCNDPC